MLSLPAPTSHNLVADWVELTTAVNDRSISRSVVAREVEASAGKAPEESFISDVWSHLRSRYGLYNPARFTVDDATVTPVNNPRSQAEYLTCLLLSLYGVHDNGPAKLFERLTCAAITQIWPGQAMVFGWPFQKKPGNKPREKTMLERFIRALAKDTNERFGDKPSSRFKDRGVDVIAWIPFSDGRSGQIVILLQCAAGHNWTAKLPVPLDAWNQYIHWAHTPVKGFAVPCVIADRIWHDTSVDKGILLDRVRIVNSVSDGVRDRSLAAELNTWANAQLKNNDE
jgi:hypothetical protein